jgi:hypothetical protein
MKYHSGQRAKPQGHKVKTSVAPFGSHSITSPSWEEGELSSGGQHRVRCPVCGYASSRGVLERDGVKEMRSAKMICVTVEIQEGTLARRIRISAPSIERALRIAGDGKPGRGVRVLFPIDPEAFFFPEGPGRREAA